MRRSPAQVVIPTRWRKAANAATGRAGIRAEALIFAAIRRHGFVSPADLACEADYHWLERDWIDGLTVDEWLSNAPSDLERNQAISAIAGTLAKVHKLLSADETVAQSPLHRNDAGTLLRDLLRQSATLGPHGVDLLRVQQLLRKNPSAQQQRLVLSHGDLSCHNIVLTPEGVALLDWEQACWAPAEMDVAFVTSAANGLCRTDAEADQFCDEYARADGSPLADMPWHRLLDAALQASAARSVGDFSASLNLQLSRAANALAGPTLQPTEN